MSHGPVMLDLSGTTLTEEEREMLQHPAAGGVILFARNFETPEQVAELICRLNELRQPSLLIAVDQEGGRVQRFKNGFTRLPPAAWFGRQHKNSSKKSKEITRSVGWLMAAELRAVGVDFSFAPVLDLGRGISQVIGDRAFNASPAIVSELALAWMSGVHEAGMAAVGKHFPGHGGVTEDSHEALPVDRRNPQDIMVEDLLPFEQMIDAGLEAIMPAHVVYEKASNELAGFSRFWLQDVLRKKLGFQGVIFSDDLTMAAAGEVGDYPERATTALDAGCDMVLVCNNPVGAGEVLESLKDYSNPAAQMRLIRMHGRKALNREEIHMDPRWKTAVEAVAKFEESSAMELDL
ncbi:MAG: beta-N-acetylhexosaminidase [Candidatus Sedimenticola sp. (ex Thyasira tokunagai)]